MILRYLGFLFVTLICAIIGFFVTPLNYFIKHYVRKYNIIPLWWFLNDTVPLSDKDRDSGDYGRFNRNFWGFFKQNALRNSHWNLRNLLRPEYGEHYDLTGDLRELSTDHNPELGFRLGTFKANGKKYFRLSWIIKILDWYHHGKFGMGNPSLNPDGTVKRRGRYYFKLKCGRFGKLNLRIENRIFVMCDLHECSEEVKDKNNMNRSVWSGNISSLTTHPIDYSYYNIDICHRCISNVLKGQLILTEKVKGSLKHSFLNNTEV